MTEHFAITCKDKVLRALQLAELEGLTEIDRICRKHRIEYSLGGGTCLGRVRHGGFIPWDDDLDVDMTVENYDRFMEVAPMEVDSSRFFLRCKATDPNHFRTAAKLEIKGTILEFGGWKNAKIKAGVFVDIFRVNYLPDDEELRKKVAHKLYMLHAVENHRMLGANTRALRENFNLFWWIVSEFIPIRWIMRWDERIINKYGRQKSNWLIGDSLASGDYSGYSAVENDEYMDVKFEGRIVRDKKNAEAFLTALYGRNYYKWLPPAARISNHKWLNFDLGSYADELNLPQDYSDYLTTRYNEKKLKQMQKVSRLLVGKIREICMRECLDFHLLSNEDSDIWTGPILIGMPRKAYEKFLECAEAGLGKKYVLQHHGNEDNYYYLHAKLRLENTEIRDSRIPEEIENSFHSGFYVDIVPMDNAPNGADQRQQQVNSAERKEQKLIIKWTRNNLFRFKKSKVRTKIKLLLMLGKKMDDLYAELNSEIQKHNSTQTEYYLYSKCESRKFAIVRKDTLHAPLQDDRMESLQDIIERVQKRYASCFLNYYDDEEYQLSVLRYDESSRRMLSNEEICKQQHMKP